MEFFQSFVMQMSGCVCTCSAKSIIARVLVNMKNIATAIKSWPTTVLFLERGSLLWPLSHHTTGVVLSCDRRNLSITVITGLYITGQTTDRRCNLTLKQTSRKRNLTKT